VARIDTCTYTASRTVGWIVSERSYPGEPRFTGIKTLVKVVSRAEHADHSTFGTRYFISSALHIERTAGAVRGHWGVESMHWLLDTEFKDSLSRHRTGHGAKNMATVRRSGRPWPRARQQGGREHQNPRATWSPAFLLEILRLK